MKRAVKALILALLAFISLIASASPKHDAVGTMIDDFKGTSLDNKTRTQNAIIGTATILIVTPTRSAGKQSQAWATELKKKGIPGGVQIRDILAIDLPFFVSDAIALSMAKEKVPKRYWSRTWLVTGEDLEKSLGVPPDAKTPFVFAIDSKGKIIASIAGSPSESKIDEIKDAFGKR